jgi:hypothetical protein
MCVPSPGFGLGLRPGMPWAWWRGVGETSGLHADMLVTYTYIHIYIHTGTSPIHVPGFFRSSGVLPFSFSPRTPAECHVTSRHVTSRRGSFGGSLSLSPMYD